VFRAEPKKNSLQPFWPSQLSDYLVRWNLIGFWSRDFRPRILKSRWDLRSRLATSYWGHNLRFQHAISVGDLSLRFRSAISHCDFTLRI